jgi:hypothetical protein
MSRLLPTGYDHSVSIQVISPKKTGAWSLLLRSARYRTLVLDNQCVAGFVEPERSSISDTDG